MATYTDANGVKLITTGDEAGTWGSSTNVNLQILDRAANGFESIALSSTTYTLTLSAQPSSAENGHYKAIKFTGSPGGTCTITLAQNDKARVYMILNSTDAALIITQGSGGNVTIEVGKGSIILADGAGSGAAVTDFTAAVQNVTDLSSPFNVGATSVTTSGAELNLLDGAAAGGITNSKAVIYGSSGEVNATTLQLAGTSITATAAELNYVDGVTSAIQTQIDSLSNGKMPLGTVAVTVAGGKFVIDGTSQQTVELKPSVTYRFDQSDNSNASHPLLFSTTSDGTHGGGAEFTTGITKVGTPGSAGSYTQVKLEQDAPAVLYYYCYNHSGMGGKAIVRISDLTANRALISGSGGDISVSGVTTTELDKLDGLTASTTELNIMDGVTATTAELNYVDGVTSSIQTQINSKQATITGAATTIDDANLTVNRAVISDGSGKIAISAVTSTEIGYLDGVTSALQTQINSKQPTITGAATTIDDANLTASRAIVSDGSGKVAVSAVTSTEIGYLDGVTSAIQTQINSKQPTITGAATTIDSSNLTASRALISSSSGKVAVSGVTTTELNKLDGLTASTSELNKVDGLTASTTELNYVDGVTSSIQTQLNNKTSNGFQYRGSVKNSSATGPGFSSSLTVSSGDLLFINVVSASGSAFGDVKIGSSSVQGFSSVFQSRVTAGSSGSLTVTQTGASASSVVVYVDVYRAD